MDRITQNTDGSYQWSCRIDTDFHKKSAVKGIWGCVIIIAVIMIIYALLPSGPGREKDIRTALIPVGVVVIIAAPLLFLQYNASEPHEQYVMTNDFVKSGYGKAAIFSEFKKTKELNITANYIELIGAHGSNRIYVPAEDMTFVRDYLIAKMPEGTPIRHN